MKHVKIASTLSCVKKIRTDVIIERGDTLQTQVFPLVRTYACGRGSKGDGFRLDRIFTLIIIGMVKSRNIKL